MIFLPILSSCYPSCTKPTRHIIVLPILRSLYPSYLPVTHPVLNQPVITSSYPSYDLLTHLIILLPTQSSPHPGYHHLIPSNHHQYFHFFVLPIVYFSTFSYIITKYPILVDVLATKCGETLISISFNPLLTHIR